MRNDWIAEKAVAGGVMDGTRWAICKHPMFDCPSMPLEFGYNGYAIFDKRPVREMSYGGLLVYVPVHGGITYAQEAEDGTMAYGFDTGHCDSGMFPICDLGWVKCQIDVMIRAIRLCAELEPEYLLSATNKERAPICGKVLALQPGQPMSMGAMLAVLGGNL